MMPPLLLVPAPFQHKARSVTHGRSHSRGAQFKVKTARLTINLLDSETQCKIHSVVAYGWSYIEDAH